jgi:hypothetical protein
MACFVIASDPVVLARQDVCRDCAEMRKCTQPEWADLVCWCAQIPGRMLKTVVRDKNETCPLKKWNDAFGVPYPPTPTTRK